MRDGASAAADTQAAMSAHVWPEGQVFRLRIGLHAGSAYIAGDDYGGLEVSRSARVASIGWGEQIVLSDAARALLVGDLPDGWAVRDLGEYRLKGLPEPERLFQLDVPGLRTAFPPLRSSVDPADRLPGRMTTFIGRESELETLERLLADTRLLTLTGPGGTGKTTLAIELARRQAGAYDDGACYVDLQAVRDPDLVRSEVARGIGLFDGAAGPAADRLDAYVADRELLVIIDNFEQVVDAAEVVADLLSASRRSRAIVTSRIPLRLRAEQEYAVKPMRVEPSSASGDAEAVRLFVDRARRSRADVDLGPVAMTTIHEICQLVDGLPLAIELCAARTSSLPLGLIRDRLAAQQPLPGSGPRDLPDRQRTIEATVAWSHDLLEAPDQRLFARLGVFEESFDHAQAEVVCGPASEIGTGVLDGLVRLTDHSLLTRVDDAVGGVRFGWLETIRAHASMRLRAAGEERTMRERHGRAFAELASDAGRHMPGAEQGRWFDRLAADDANLRAATRFVLKDGSVEMALGLVGDLWRYWLQSGRLSEGRTLVAEALAMPGAETPTQARCRALDAAGGVAYWSAEPQVAHERYVELLELAQRIGDRESEAVAWFDLFHTYGDRAEPDRAIAAKASAERLYRDLGDEFGLRRVEHMATLIVLGRDLLDPSEIEAAAARAEATGDPWLMRLAPTLRGYIAFMSGDYAVALRQLALSLRGSLAVRELTDAALGAQFFVIGAPLIGHAEAGAVVHGACQGAFERMGIRPPATYEDLVGTDPIPLIESQLGVEAFAAAVDRGRRLSVEEAIDLIGDVAAAA
jgi:predicted ATPase